MRGLFQRTSAPIQTAMLVEMIRLLQQCQEVITLPEVGDEPSMPDMTAEAYRLEKMGFTNARPMAKFRQQIEEYERSRKSWDKRMRAQLNVQSVRLNRIATVRTLIEARKTFGEDTLLIPYGDFEQLIRKYNLVCGPFSSYKGDIPADKLNEISDLQQLMKDKKPSYINKLAPITSLEYSSVEYAWFNIPGYIKRFPFAKKSASYNSWWPDWLVDMHGNKIRDSWKSEYKTGSPISLFICAPSRDMEKIRAIRSPRILSYSDPFICAHTDYGILVFTRWGEEADDKIIRKYEAANVWLDKARNFITTQFKEMAQSHGGFSD